MCNSIETKLVRNIGSKSRLYITSNVNDKFIHELSRFLKCTEVRDLHFHNAKLTNQQAEEVYSGLPGSQVQLLDLSYNDIGLSLGKLASILSDTQINSINLASTNMVDQDLTEEFLLSIKEQKIKFLDLSYNHIGNEKLKKIAQILANSSISSLDFKGNDAITSDGAIHAMDIVENLQKKFFMSEVSEEALENIRSTKSAFQEALLDNYYSHYLNSTDISEFVENKELENIRDKNIYLESSEDEDLYSESSGDGTDYLENTQYENSSSSYIEYKLPIMVLSVVTAMWGVDIL
ncbi:hypothetical protein NOVO_01245 [Rickettsiales bacterium Ac37b]|nr:hypothetical protein NOVO_01245 [Rickettsiales bacterium Ac37b]